MRVTFMNEKRGESVRLLSSLRWRKNEKKVWALCRPTWTSNIMEWMFPLCICFWDQISLFSSVKLEKLVTLKGTLGSCPLNFSVTLIVSNLNGSIIWRVSIEILAVLNIEVVYLILSTLLCPLNSVYIL